MLNTGDRIPKVSFCMSTYKRPGHLKSTLEAIARQTFPDFEVVISDNDPEGSAEAVVKQANDPRFRYFNNGENLGMIKSFNKSIERSQAVDIVMITDDDPVYPDMLATLMRLKSEYPGYGLYIGGCDWFCTDPEVAALYKLRIGTNSCLSDQYELDHVIPLTTDKFLRLFFTFGLFPHYLWSTCIVSKQVLLKAGGVPDYGSPFLGDYAYLSILGSHSGCVVINRSLGCQTMHKENFGRKQNDQLVTVVKNFPVYLEGRMQHLANWPAVQKIMIRFTALWAIEHMSFLYHYRKKASADEESLRQAEKDVFRIPYMRPYRFKYFLKKHFPWMNTLLVKLKSLTRG